MTSNSFPNTIIWQQKMYFIHMSFINLRIELTGLAVFNILMANLSMLRWASPNWEKASLAAGCGSLTPMAENTSPNPKLQYNLYYTIKLLYTCTSTFLLMHNVCTINSTPIHYHNCEQNSLCSYFLSQWFLFYTKWYIFQQYHDKN